MIIFPRFGRSAGNLGNQMMQLMSMVGLSRRYNTEFVVPTWKYAEYFNSPPFQIGDYSSRNISIDRKIDESKYHFDLDQWGDLADGNNGIFGWLQSQKYWEDYKDDVCLATQFTNEFYQATYNKIRPSTWEKPTIAISIRRGDYVGNKNYDLLPARYYIMALLEHFPDFQENYNVLLFSDDFAYCHIHFDCIKPYFAEGLSDIEQLCLLTMCDNFILANSSFSIVGAMLAELQSPMFERKIIRPAYIFAGDLLMKNDDKDLYPEHWIRFDHKPQKINLRDVTFTIPVNRDSQNREDNVKMCIDTLLRDFDTNIIMGEQGPRPEFAHYSGLVRYHYFEGMPEFHRTKMLNDMALMATTGIVANWDADVIVPPLQVWLAIQQLKSREADIVYPYDGRFARVDRKRWYSLYTQYLDAGMFGDTQFPGTFDHDARSVGGALFYNVEAFLKAGMENENMVNYGPEDCERWDRFHALGLKVRRTDGRLFHMDHTLSLNSSNRHEHYNANVAELDKIRNMSREQLQSYVESWPWAKRYTPMYYESIFEEAVKSRDAVFEVLRSFGMLKPKSHIIDVGCGIGAWGYGLKEQGFWYEGMDFGVPQEKLVIGAENYKDHDLRTPIPLHPYGPANGYKADLVLCLEVAEHLEPEFADTLIETLVKLGEHILFSAAIPGQGGVNHHNEQWQSYWQEKFATHGYVPYACDIRHWLWSNPDVGVWYRQNMVLYAKSEVEDHDYYLDVVHPEMYMNLMRHHRIL